jgi:hypothetical protein
VGDSAFNYIAPELWNSIPHMLAILASTNQFKKKLKTHLFMSNVFISVLITVFMSVFVQALCTRVGKGAISNDRIIISIIINE